MMPTQTIDEAMPGYGKVSEETLRDTELERMRVHEEVILQNAIADARRDAFLEACRERRQRI